jgi:alpha-galactosidase
MPPLAIRMRPRSPRVVSICLLLVTLFRGTAAAAASVIAENGDASIAHDDAAGTWRLSSGGAMLTIAADAARDFAVTSLVSSSGRAWTAGSASDSFVRVSGRTLAFGSRAAGFEFKSAGVAARGKGFELRVGYALPAASLALTRHYAIVPGSPTFEVWTTFSPAGGVPAIADINALLLTLPNGTIHWVTGLRGDAADVESEGAFTRESTALAPGEHLTLGAARRASEDVVPWFAIDAPASAGTAPEQFYAALMWSGAWALDIGRAGATIGVVLGLAPMSTTLQAPIDGPHVVFGAVPGGAAQASAALAVYILDGIRDGRPLAPLVTYNTWYAYGTTIDEPSMRDEMDRAARLGVELFVIDAGWYPNTGVEGPADFDSGLGAWTADPDRFPNGLAPLREHAHALGMQFGLWVEPERVNLAVVADVDLDEAWLATTGGEYGSDHAAQICLAGAAAHAWLLDHLTALIDEVQPDYLKVDNNMFVNCDRAGHGHGATDGNFAHVNGLYTLLSALRERYPDLAIENVSGGGNRLDVGMLRYSDVAWMDDRTAPSIHVRHNIEGLSAVFPPAYLLSFVTDHEGEPLHDSPDLALYFRSRMAGALGLCFRADGFSEGDESDITREIAIYKAIRGTVSVAAGSLLTRQTASDDPPPWDVLQETAAGYQQFLIAAFQSDEGVQTFNVRPSTLQPDVTYQVQSVDTGILGTATGAELMANGIDVIESPRSAAHILIITAQQP